MFALFDDAGKFLAGRVMSEADSSMQIELDSGKRVKVKAANVLLKFAKPSPAELLAQAAAQSTDIDLDLIWEVAPEEEFGFDELAREYFNANADAAQQAAMLMRLFETPHYFHRRGKGRFRKAPEDILKQALVAIDRKKQQALQIEQWAEDLPDHGDRRCAVGAGSGHGHGHLRHPHCCTRPGDCARLGSDSSANPGDLGNIAGQIKAFLALGMDGFFTDHPFLGRQARDAFADQ